MPQRSALSSAVRTLIAVLAFAAVATTAKAQTTSGPVYEFTVEGVVHQADAKPLVYALMEQPFATACSFIPECACFKVEANGPVTYAALRDAVAMDGHVLSGDVLVSDGSVLHAPQALDAK